MYGQNFGDLLAADDLGSWDSKAVHMYVCVCLFVCLLVCLTVCLFV